MSIEFKSDDMLDQGEPWRPLQDAIDDAFDFLNNVDAEHMSTPELYLRRTMLDKLRNINRALSELINSQ